MGYLFIVPGNGLYCLIYSRFGRYTISDVRFTNYKTRLFYLVSLKMVICSRKCSKGIGASNPMACILNQVGYLVHLQLVTHAQI